MTEYEDYYDFDAEWASKRAQPPRAKIMGRVYTLAAEIPAKSILVSVKAQKQGIEHLDIDELLDSIGMMVGGRENADQMMADGIGLTQLIDVMTRCMTLIRDGLPEEIRGEVDAPTLGGALTSSTASSATGGRSMRTGAASTAPTSRPN